MTAPHPFTSRSGRVCGHYDGHRMCGRYADNPIHPEHVNEGPKMHPQPVVRARDAREDEIPRSASRFASAAQEAGWSTTIHYARGTDMNRRGETTKVADSIVVRCFGREGWRPAVGCWVDGKFDSGWLLSPITRVGSVGLNDYVRRGVSPL